MHPETKAGVAGGKASAAIRGTTEPGSLVEIPSFADDTAAKTGITARTVQQNVQIAEDLTPEAKQAAKELDLRKKETVAR